MGQTLSAKITRLNLAAATLGTLLESDKAHFSQNTLDALLESIPAKEAANLALSEALQALIMSPELQLLEGSLIERLETFLRSENNTLLKENVRQLKNTLERVYPELLALSAIVQNSANHYAELLFAAIKGPDAENLATYNRSGLLQEG